MFQAEGTVSPKALRQECTQCLLRTNSKEASGTGEQGAGRMVGVCGLDQNLEGCISQTG